MLSHWLSLGKHKPMPKPSSLLTTPPFEQVSYVHDKLKRAEEREATMTTTQH